MAGKAALPAPHGTPFQRRVWAELTKIPYGTTVTYGELARRIGRPKAVRAVASAVARNPLPILIPCHRVVLAGGKGAGNYRLGREIKEKLLSLEKVMS